ncbi:MAG: preprotein translocase subunit SecA [Candidatus Omnitrophota bacterium]|jgi:preprotein translocase subunit SecA
MFGFFKKAVLAGKQKAIDRKYKGINITLHPDMPMPSLDAVVSLAGAVAAVNAWEEEAGRLSDAELRGKSEQFREYLREKEKACAEHLAEIALAVENAAIAEEKERLKERLKLARNRVFDGILAEAFAVVREASRRTIGLRHFDSQIIGGLILHQGKIAEMSTGEGKTLVATLPAYLNALLGRGVHIVTVNDYLARRDREWMGPVFEFLGLSVGVIQHDMSDEARKSAYACDITYGTNNEFGFDYLRDNMKYSSSELVQRPFYYAIVDEVDSILVDEARTPLIISGPAEESTDKYYTIDRIIPRLEGKLIMEKEQIEAKYKGVDLSKGYDYVVDEKARNAYLTEQGEAKICSLLNIPSLHDMETMEWRHHVIQALRAHNLYKRDVDYVVKDGQVIIVDEFTGRLMPGRRWSDGLHQAVEAKERMKIERENQTLATITFQNFFRMYEKLSGMTGTAYTEANEFKAIYKLDVVAVPTNRPLIRINYPDRIYKTEAEKFNAVVEEITRMHSSGRPVLVGTVSIEKSELLSGMLKKRGIEHQVLNAKYHEMEAQIVAQAGRYKTVTIATNMAGRGTDILLGGNPGFIARSVLNQKEFDGEEQRLAEYTRLLEKYRRETEEEHRRVVEAGGLHIIGTERHEARRIDNQLRGRSGRQGDPGSSRFYVSLRDNLMRLFGSDRLVGIMDRLGLEEGQVIEHPWINKSIEVAQRRVEQHNFEIRKQLLEYDNVMNKQREVVYSQRRQILDGISLKDNILAIMERSVSGLAGMYSGEGSAQPDYDGLLGTLKLKFGLEFSREELLAKEGGTLSDIIYTMVSEAYFGKEKEAGEENMRLIERMVFLQIIDSRWKDHLYAMDNLREGIGLRAYGQRDPLVEYKREAFEMFNNMISAVEEESLEILFKLRPEPRREARGVFSTTSQELSHPEAGSFAGSGGREDRENTIAPAAGFAGGKAHGDSAVKVGRNDPCPCGSGKKFKKCCGR